jgi:DNA-binding response OmpR family regulator
VLAFRRPKSARTPGRFFDRAVMNTASLSKPINKKPVITALLVSPFPSDHVAVQEVFSYLGWVLNAAYDCAEASAFMRQSSTSVVICDCDLRDGNWKKDHQVCAGMPEPPRLLVSSHLVESELLNEARDLGAYSVLASPLDSREIAVRVQNVVAFLASRMAEHWRRLTGSVASSSKLGITVARVVRLPGRPTHAADN